MNVSGTSSNKIGRIGTKWYQHRDGSSHVWTSIHLRISSISILRLLTKSFVTQRERERERERERGEGRGDKGPAIITLLKGHSSQCVKMFTATNAPGAFFHEHAAVPLHALALLSSCFATVVQLRRSTVDSLRVLLGWKPRTVSSRDFASKRELPEFDFVRRSFNSSWYHHRADW